MPCTNEFMAIGPEAEVNEVNLEVVFKGVTFENSKVYFNDVQRYIPKVLQIMYIASAVFLAGWIELSCRFLTGERQSAVIRSKYVHVLLNQDMSFFDTYGNNGDIVGQVLSNVLLIQSALSEKVGNYIHNMVISFGGLVIGLINCWQIALLTLATGPVIVVAGGICNTNSLRGFEVIDAIKSDLEFVCPGIVSCADILATVARDSIVLSNGPGWDVQMIKKDSLTASFTDTNNNLPFPKEDLKTILTKFQRVGVDIVDGCSLRCTHNWSS